MQEIVWNATRYSFMREPDKDYGRLLHMLEMADLLEVERTTRSIDDILNDRVLFYGL